METFSALLAICAANSPVSGEFPTQRTVTRSFDVFFDQRLNKRLSKQWWGWWFETPSDPLWCHCNPCELRWLTWNIVRVSHCRCCVIWKFIFLSTSSLVWINSYQKKVHNCNVSSCQPMSIIQTLKFWLINIYTTFNHVITNTNVNNVRHFTFPSSQTIVLHFSTELYWVPLKSVSSNHRTLYHAGPSWTYDNAARYTNAAGVTVPGRGYKGIVCFFAYQGGFVQILDNSCQVKKPKTSSL